MMGKERALLLSSLLFVGSLYGVELNKNLSLDISITSVYQEAKFFKDLSGSVGKGSIATDIGLNFHPTDEDQAQLTFSFAAGNALNPTFEDKGFTLVPYADDLENDLKNINGRNRDYLLEAWYQHTFRWEGLKISPTVGIIDSTAYIDDNAYANDETTQFMNDVFVNNPLARLPSYDLGGVIEIEKENLTVKGLVMNTKNDQGQDYDYYAVQLGYSLNVPSLGSGNYRIYYYRTTKDFENSRGERDYIEGIGLSLDQELNQYLGSFLRLGLNTHPSTGDYKNLLSGGVQLSGNLWNRSKDIFAVGWAYLDGNPKVSGIKNSIVGEAYYKIPLTEYSDLTLDGQYYTEKHTDQSLGAWAFGLRLNVSF